jgi:hypothetical protein
MGDKEFAIALMAMCSIGITIALLALSELRAHWKQREELNRLLILALLRISKRQISTTEEQTRHIDALLEELRAGRSGKRLDPALLAEAQRESDAVEEEAAAEEASARGARRRGEQSPP